jgi:DNA-binding transcriptional LysR family regulator
MDDSLELRHLRYFVAVAEELHFGRAAAKLHLSQPPLSQQIQKLEQMLGFALFQRSSRSVMLTPAGAALFQTTQRSFAHLQSGIEEARSIAAGEVGSLHVGFISSAMLSSLPGIFNRYRNSYPKVRMHLHESYTSRVVDGLRDGTLDAGILRDSEPVEGFRVETILRERFVAVIPATHPCARQKSISPGALKDHGFVYFPLAAGARAHEKPFAAFERYGFRPQVVQEASHWVTILRLVGAGLGVSVAPECVRRIATPDVACLRLRGTDVASDLELAYREGDNRSIVARFAQIVLGTRPQA